jgi:arsenate reductase (glutaredoxin)
VGLVACADDAAYRLQDISKNWANQMSNEIKMYGIPGCDTVKKARVWMEKNGVSYVFHDYKKSGIAEDKLEEWMLQVDLDVLLNKRGTTFRALPDIIKQNINEKSAIKLMKENPSMIKRPIVEGGPELIVGYSQAEFSALK